jgi:alpha-amylase
VNRDPQDKLATAVSQPIVPNPAWLFMSQPIRLVLVLHDHQPVGNFDHVFEQAYEDAYKPFLDVFERYPQLKLGLHTSGPLMEWFDARHPEYLDRLSALIAAGRLEIIGGPFYEPILSMIPPRDRIGQIATYSRWLENRLGATVRDCWIPERVWEQSFTSDLVAAGIQYTMLDDSHFKNAGLSEDELHGYYLTEDDGNLLAVFPDSEPLRYMIPFAPPQDTIDYLGRIREQFPGAIAVFGDDGEKFGAWPGTKQSVYEEGWLTRFFNLLVEHQSWIHTCLPAEVYDSTPPIGKVYLPEGSYREMTEWVLPVEQLSEYVQVRREMEHDPRWPRIARFVRGGFWRNFKVKYPETNEMYCRMMMVSKRFEELSQDPAANREVLEHARTALYRSQCNCSYWHGAFGGVYLPHLRNGVYQQLIAADTLLDQVAGKHRDWAEATADDFNLDGRQEVMLANDRAVALIAPSRGGQLYELDVRAIQHNLLATLTRRPEAYHGTVAAGESAGANDVAAVSTQVVFKQDHLADRLIYDQFPRKSLLDHFFDLDANVNAVARSESPQRGDFVHRNYEARIRRSPNRVQVLLSTLGNVEDVQFKLTKGVTLEADSSTFEITYLLEHLPPGRQLHFAPEFNFAGLPSGAEDRFFYGGNRQPLGHLGTQLDLTNVDELGLVDEWLGIDVNLSLSRPSGIWAFPVETVSQSEGGFEAVHQSVCVMPHWIVEADKDGAWTVTIQLTLDTSLAESRKMETPAAVAVGVT